MRRILPSAIALVLMMVIFTAFVVHVLNMLTGNTTHAVADAPTVLPEHRTSLTSGIPLIVGLVAAAAVGITIWPIERLLHSAAGVLAR